MAELTADALPRHLQLLWGREPEGRRGPRPTLSIRKIGEAAVAIADRDGLDAVSMKSVAAALGMTSMSLYRYVDSKDALLEVMLDGAYGPCPITVRDNGSGWRARLTAWARALAATRLDHPWIPQATPKVPPTSPHVLDWTDAGVAALTDLPLDGQQRLSALLVLDGYLSSHLQLARSIGLGAGAPNEQPSGLSYSQRMALLVTPERLPALAEAALDAFDVEDEDDPEEFYESELAFGIELVLDGIAALASASSSKVRSRAGARRGSVLS